MTPQGGLLFLTIFAVLYLMREGWRSANRCGYCGSVAGHDEHCPYNGTGL